MKLTDQQIADFRESVWAHYAHAARTMPWRDNPAPYWVLVSEIMLQQTQVGRVLPKFTAFVARFPTIADLARAPLGAVLTEWSGLGYNRRAKFLHQAAQAVVERFGGELPTTLDDLVSLPGIGKNTAGAILAYAYNQPVLFVETNIRSVYFHHFFPGAEAISDKEVLELLEQTIDHEHPREWYWALMDYGTHLKQTHGNNISRSKHYSKQSAFAGSLRQIRGQVLKALVDAPLTNRQLSTAIPDDRLPAVLAALQQEGFITKVGSTFRLS